MKKRIYALSMIIFLLDQIIKMVIMLTIPYQSVIHVIPGFFYLTHVKNTGGAWSLLDKYPYILIMIGIVFLIGFGYYLNKKEKFATLENVSIGFLLGGVLGNLVDRIFRHGVIDFIGFIFGSYYFPVFNLADIMIVCGGILLIIDCFRGDINGIRSNKR